VKDAPPPQAGPERKALNTLKRLARDLDSQPDAKTVEKALAAVNILNPPAEPRETATELVRRLHEESGGGEALALLDNLLKQLKQRLDTPADCDVLDFLADPLPDPLLRGTNTGGSVLSRGEVLVLSGAGGRGKSTLAIQWAVAAAVGDATGRRWITCGGVQAKAGRTLIVNWEDSGRRIADRTLGASHLPSVKSALDGADFAQAVRGRIRALPFRGRPLFGVEDGEHRLNRPRPLAHAWSPVWQAVKRSKSDVLVLDPALSAYVADQNDTAFVRLFIDALVSEAEAHRCGILLVAHSAKSARGDAASRHPGSVSGSAAWHDAARAVLTLKAGTNEDSGSCELRCVKANYSPMFTRKLRKHMREGPHWPEMVGFEDDKSTVLAGACDGAAHTHEDDDEDDEPPF